MAVPGVWLREAKISWAAVQNGMKGRLERKNGQVRVLRLPTDSNILAGE
jgi:hypothetical protein